MAASIATITGTALLPGVSRNKRFYSPELIGKAVTRAQARLAAGDMPLTMRVAHPADEPRAPVTEIAGRITRIWQETDGRARFEATVSDTRAGRDVFGLIDNRDGEPFVRGVSIRGGWLGATRKVHTADGLAETADDLEIDGLDFTHKPGVPGAAVEHVSAPDAPTESSPVGRTPIFESVQEALVTAITEADAPAQAANTPGKVFADPGYQKDGKKRYPLDSKSEAKAAWSYINQAKDAAEYTAPQLKRIRARIIKALKKFGVEVDVKEGWVIERGQGQVNEAALVEHYGGEYPNPASIYITLDNGMVCINVSSYCIDPADLDLVARKAMEGACAALATIDPDDDGDIDLPGEPEEAARDEDDLDDGDADDRKRTSESEEDAPSEPVTEPVTEPAGEPAPEPVDTPAPEPAADPTPEQEEPAVSEPTSTPAVAPSPAAVPAPTVTLTDEQFTTLLSRLTPAPAMAGAPAESAPAAETVAETAPAAPAEPAQVTESEADRIKRLVEEQVSARVTEAVQAAIKLGGPPARKGLVGRVNESGEVQTAGAGTSELNEHGVPTDWPNKPLHEYTTEERNKYLSSALLQHVIGNRG